MKAIGAGIGQGVWFSHIEVLGGPTDPSLRPHGPAADLLKRLGVTAVNVTGSGDSRLAVAVVVLERRTGAPCWGKTPPR